MSPLIQACREYRRSRNNYPVSGSMKNLVSEDITAEKLNWIIKYVDEMFRDLDDTEHDTF